MHESALSDCAGRATIHMPLAGVANHGMASLFTPSGDSDAVEVSTQRMDEALAGTQPKLIKIDVEGAEPLAVAGMAGLVQVENPPRIVAEYNVDTARQAGFSPREFVDRLMKLQPRYQIDVIGWRMRRMASIDAALAGRAMANLLFTIVEIARALNRRGLRLFAWLALGRAGGRQATR